MHGSLWPVRLLRGAVLPSERVMNDNIFIGIVEFIVLLLSLSVHECAHAWTAAASATKRRE